MFTFMMIDENITHFSFYLIEKYENKHVFGFVVTRPEQNIVLEAKFSYFFYLPNKSFLCK